MVLIRLATHHDLQFLIACVNKDWSINDKAEGFSDWMEDFKKILPADMEYDDRNYFQFLLMYLLPNSSNKQIFIVNNGQKDIGFFTQDEDENNSTFGGTAWVHPRSCKMSILKLVKAMTIRGVLIIDQYDKVELNTWHPLIVSTVKAIIPKFEEYKIYDTYRIMFCTKDKFPEAKEIIDRFNVTDIDSNYCFAFDER